MSDIETDRNRPESLPPAEHIAEELRGVKSMNEFFGREGMFARLFARTLEEMLETELTQHLGYERYAPEGRNSGNSRNGHYGKKVRTSAGEQTIAVPRATERGSSVHRSCSATPTTRMSWRKRSPRCTPRACQCEISRKRSKS